MIQAQSSAPMIASPPSSRIRAFTADDVPQVADLHRRAFQVADHPTPELMGSYQIYLTQVYLENPCQQGAVASLVYEDKNGKVVGFLAAVPRRMSFNGEAIQGMIASQLVVDPETRGGAGVKLVDALLAGSHDFTIADEANSDSRRIFEGLGGVTSHVYGMRWIYPLRPCQFGRFVANRKDSAPGFLSALSTPIALTLDKLAQWLLKFPNLPSAPSFAGEELVAETLVGFLSEAGRKESIRSDHDGVSLNWALKRAGQLRRNGRLQKVLVKDEKGRIAGCYIYYLNPNGISEVIGLYANAGFAHHILEHLFEHAWRLGAIALSGRMQAGFSQAFSDKHCLLHCGPLWVMIHSRRPELVQAFNRGNAGFSRLDGEWCLHFR